MLAHIIAFAFHRKAFNDRMETLKHDLKVIDHLRGYRPKRHTSKPTPHRPVFSLAGRVTATPPFERSGFSFGVDSGTANENHELLHHHRNRPMSPAILSDDEGHVGDIEEGTGHGSPRSRKGKERRSWIFPSAISLGHGSQGTDDTSTAPALADHPYYAHIYPPTTHHSSEQGNSSRSRRVTPQPTRSHEEDAAVVVQAAKALKTAMMHDARNIKGKETDLSKLGKNINSAHEAKVQCFMP